MKKSVVSAITTAMLIGVASTTFASANPFSDVPADHWAYDAVSQLAKDGVIEGYGDSTFKGESHITRYEMAQMVAKAMAKENASNETDRALIDKLSAEFHDELSNLGVRVSNLENKTDNVKWTGEIRYTYDSVRHDQNIKTGKNHTKDNDNLLTLRFTPTATINEHWQAKARIEANINTGNDTYSDNTKLNRAYAEGNYSNTNIKLGKIPFTVDNDLIFNYDHQFSGGQVSLGNKNVRATIGAGRFSGDSNTTNFDSFKVGSTEFSDTANYQFVGLEYNKNKFSGGVAYHHLNSDYFKTIIRNDKTTTADAQILGVNAQYQFDKNIGIIGDYAKNYKQDEQAKSASIQLNYKGAEAYQKGSWGTFVAYRYLGGNVSIDPSYDGASIHQKGWELGANYTIYPNTVFTAKYFTGTDLDVTSGDNVAKKIFGRVQFYF